MFNSILTSGSVKIKSQLLFFLAALCIFTLHGYKKVGEGPGFVLSSDPGGQKITAAAIKHLFPST